MAISEVLLEKILKWGCGQGPLPAAGGPPPEKAPGTPALAHPGALTQLLSPGQVFLNPRCLQQGRGHVRALPDRIQKQHQAIRAVPQS